MFGSFTEPFNYETEKITRKASDAEENLQLYRVVRFSPKTSADICVVISGGRTEQHFIIGFGELAAVN